MTNYILYKHTFPNGKIYFGITCQKVEVRWRKDGSGYKNNKLMWKAIKKYGWDNIKHEIIFENLSEQTANELEIKLIAEYKTQDTRFGYNIMPGGLVATGWHHTEESKKKMSASQLGKRYMAEPWNKGKHYGKKKVYQYSVNGEFIKEFANVHEASLELSIPEVNIFDNVRLASKTCYGYIFAREYMSSEQLMKLYAREQGAKRVTIFQYDEDGKLLNTFRSYKAVMDELNICESCLEQCLAGKQKTSNGFVFSKVQLSVNEVRQHYISKKRKQKYKYYLISRETGLSTLYNTIDEMSIALCVDARTLRNVVNGGSSKLHKLYIFKKELNNEN